MNFTTKQPLHKTEDTAPLQHYPKAITTTIRMSGEDNELKRTVEELREQNEVLGLAIQRSRHAVKRLKLEYGVLLERLEQRVEIDPLLRYDNPLPNLEAFRKELLAKPLKRAKTKRQKAKERDPNMPKRPTNAYLIYCEMNKEKVRSSGSADVTRDLTDGWKNLDEEGRAPYYKLYNEDRDRYRREMEAYTRGRAGSGIKTEGDGEVDGNGDGDGENDEDDDDDDNEDDEDDDDDGEENETHDGDDGDDVASEQPGNDSSVEPSKIPEDSVLPDSKLESDESKPEDNNKPKTEDNEQEEQGEEDANAS